MQPFGPHFAGQERVLVMGESGSGKTYHVRALTDSAWRVIWFDVEDEYDGPGRLALDVSELKRHIGYLDLAHARIVVKPRRLVRTTTDRGSPKTLRGAEAVAHDAAELCELLLDRYSEHRTGNLIAVFGEVGVYGRIAPAESAIADLFQRARKRRIVPLFESQSFQHFPVGAREQATDVFVLQQTHPIQVRELSAVYGPEIAERARSWKPYQPPAHFKRGHGVIHA